MSGAGLDESGNIYAPPSHPGLDASNLSPNLSAPALAPPLPNNPSKLHAHVDDIYQRWSAYLTCAKPAVPLTDSDSDGAEIAQMESTDIVSCLRERLAGVMRRPQSSPEQLEQKAKRMEKRAEHRRRLYKRQEELLRDMEYMTMAYGY